MKKPCQKCKEVKVLSEFNKNKKYDNGVDKLCRACSNKLSKQWKENNLDRAKKGQKEWRDANPEKVKEGVRKWAENNKDNRRKYMVEYRERNKDQAAVTASERRARKRNQTHKDANKIDIKRFYRVTLYLSKFSGKKYSIDHILPLSKGGLHREENLQIIPAKINHLKHKSLKYKHPSILHWTDLPQNILDLHPKEVIEAAYLELNAN